MITSPVKVKCQLIQTKHSVSYGRVTKMRLEKNNILLPVYTLDRLAAQHKEEKKLSRKIVKRKLISECKHMSIRFEF